MVLFIGRKRLIRVFAVKIGEVVTKKDEVVPTSLERKVFLVTLLMVFVTVSTYDDKATEVREDNIYVHTKNLVEGLLVIQTRILLGIVHDMGLANGTKVRQDFQRHGVVIPIDVPNVDTRLKGTLGTNDRVHTTRIYMDVKILVPVQNKVVRRLIEVDSDIDMDVGNVVVSKAVFVRKQNVFHMVLTIGIGEGVGIGIDVDSTDKGFFQARRIPVFDYVLDVWALVGIGEKILNSI